MFKWLFKRTALLFLPVGILSVVTVMSLWGFHRLTLEEPVAVLSFKQLSPQQYYVRLTEQNGKLHTYTLLGDEWELDAKIIKFTAIANSMGQHTLYRLERLGSRYTEITSAQALMPTAIDLSANTSWRWDELEQLVKRLPGVDAAYGSSVYLPMRDNQTYEVTLSTSGLIARPLDNNS